MRIKQGSLAEVFEVLGTMHMGISSDDAFERAHTTAVVIRLALHIAQVTGKIQHDHSQVRVVFINNERT